MILSLFNTQFAIGSVHKLCQSKMGGPDPPSPPLSAIVIILQTPPPPLATDIISEQP